MTDQPQRPDSEPEGRPETPPAAPGPTPPAQHPNGAAPPPNPYGTPPPPQGGYPAPQPGYGAPQQGGYGAPQQGGYGAPQQGGYGAPQQGGYGAPPGGNPYGTPPPQNPYGAAAPGANPYAPNPYATAPAYAGGPPLPGTIGFVEANFGRVAGFGDRVVAYLIDVAVVLVGLVFVVLGGILIGAGSPTTVTFDNGATTTTGGDGILAGVGVLFMLVGFVTMFGLWLWNRVFRMGRTGQSVGKRTQNLMLVDARTGRPIGAGNAFLREVVNGLVNQVVYLGFLWMLWDPDKQTLGDKAVHSAVIHVARDAATPGQA